MQIFLILNIVFLDFLCHLDSLGKHSVPFLHGEPFHACHKFVNEARTFVFIANSPQIHFNIVFSNQWLWLQVKLFHIQRSSVQLSTSRRSILWCGSVIIIFLDKSFMSLIGLLQIEFQLAKEERRFTANTLESFTGKSMVGPATQQFVFEMLQFVLPMLKEVGKRLLGEFGTWTIGYRHTEGPMNLIAHIGNSLGLRNTRNALE